MLKQFNVQKIGKSKRVAAFGLVAILAAKSAMADVDFSASVDRREIPLSGTVALRITIRSEDQSGSTEPSFEASDFQVLNDYKSISVESHYDSNSGRFQVTRKNLFTKVLRPTKLGLLKISKIQLNTGGKILRAPDITVRVVSSSAGGNSNNANSPSRRYDDDSDVGLGKPVFVRAEVSRKAAYKGQQIVVSYYVYHRVRIFNLQLDKFPSLPGFLREDLDVPLVSQRYQVEEVKVNGVPYQRTLLARYAAYPLQDGNLEIDPMSIKFSYYSKPQEPAIDDEDPFFGFFQQLVPKNGASESEKVTIHITPLPENGRPADFSGGVGKFSVVSAIDKYEVRQDEAVTLTLKVEGQGNISAINSPKLNLPDGIELFESKGRSQNSKSGLSEKIFEILFIPRRTGSFTLPGVEFSFFDPDEKIYYKRSTEPVILNILPSQKSPEEIENRNVTTVPSNHPSEEPRGFKLPDETGLSKTPFHLWRLFYWAFAGVFAAFISLIGIDSIRRKREQARTKGPSPHAEFEQTLQKLRQLSKESGGSGAHGGAPSTNDQIVQIYDDLMDAFSRFLDHKFGVHVQGLSRLELENFLLQCGVKPEIWQQLASLYEFAESVQYSHQEAAEKSPAWIELPKKLNDAEEIFRAISNLR